MADGHSAGVLSGAEFKAAETKLREERRREAAAMDPSESGAHAATVYRDRRTGKAINLADEAARGPGALCWAICFSRWLILAPEGPQVALSV